MFVKKNKDTWADKCINPCSKTQKPYKKNRIRRLDDDYHIHSRQPHTKQTTVFDRNFPWSFIIVDVSKPILGISFSPLKTFVEPQERLSSIWNNSAYLPRRSDGMHDIGHLDCYRSNPVTSC